MVFPRQEYGSGLPFPPPGDLTNPGIELRSLASPALVGGCFSIEPRGRTYKLLSCLCPNSPLLGSNNTFIPDKGGDLGYEVRTLNLT